MVYKNCSYYLPSRKLFFSPQRPFSIIVLGWNTGRKWTMALILIYNLFFTAIILATKRRISNLKTWGLNDYSSMVISFIPGYLAPFYNPSYMNCIKQPLSHDHLPLLPISFCNKRKSFQKQINFLFKSFLFNPSKAFFCYAKLP